VPPALLSGLPPNRQRNPSVDVKEAGALKVALNIGRASPGFESPFQRQPAGGTIVDCEPVLHRTCVSPGAVDKCHQRGEAISQWRKAV
jgi:hypothetical protein